VERGRLVRELLNRIMCGRGVRTPRVSGARATKCEVERGRRVRGLLNRIMCGRGVRTPHVSGARATKCEVERGRLVRGLLNRIMCGRGVRTPHVSGARATKCEVERGRGVRTPFYRRSKYVPGAHAEIFFRSAAARTMSPDSSASVAYIQSVSASDGSGSV